MRACRYILLAVGLAAALVVGCGGGGTGYGPCGDEPYCDEDYPQYRYLTIYLRVEDPGGEPVGAAEVRINGCLVDDRTAGRWYYIGSTGPKPWRGWRYNWAVEDFRVRLDYPAQTRHLHVEVSKPGYGSDDVVFEVSDDDPEYLYARAVLLLGASPARARAAGQAEYFRPRPGAAPAL
jgi:hypothetical protein